jgi:hypothetical protein
MAQALAMYAKDLPSITKLVTVNGTPTYKVAEWFKLGELRDHFALFTCYYLIKKKQLFQY